MSFSSVGSRGAASDRECTVAAKYAVERDPRHSWRRAVTNVWEYYDTRACGEVETTPHTVSDCTPIGVVGGLHQQLHLANESSQLADITL